MDQTEISYLNWAWKNCRVFSVTVPSEFCMIDANIAVLALSGSIVRASSWEYEYHFMSHHVCNEHQEYRASCHLVAYHCVLSVVIRRRFHGELMVRSMWWSRPESSCRLRRPTHTSTAARRRFSFLRRRLMHQCLWWELTRANMIQLKWTLSGSAILLWYSRHCYRAFSHPCCEYWLQYESLSI